MSTRSSVLEPLSIYVDSFLRPLIPAIPSYVKDTTHFLQILTSHLQWAGVHSILMVTLDVTSLYTSIPQTAAYDVVVAALRNRGDLSDTHLEFLMNLMHLVLFHNHYF